ncbi:GGDEF domain-containing protein [Rheinheimera salexigens]|uniref:diguanylate cyclase n=1 Tax=Rheinheimera salexigens TaxID=1628148 RepID=A0A1E7Q3H4_9GAMM|nr:GGDEF domain-containing protein [Rheinheimera salexigens]OEY68707.1 diguanylate cyclase [Rheinheimera salexigens]
MQNELQEKFRLSVLSLLGVVSVLGITPFVFIRYFQGNVLAAIIDLILVLGIVTLVGYAVRTKKTRVVSWIVAVFINTGVYAIVLANGVDSVLWVYPVIASTFFMVKPIEALGINICLMVACVFLPNVFDVISLVSFLVTLLMVSVTTYVYASRSEKQLRLLESLNTVDELTGAFNRRALTSDIAQALAIAERKKTPYMLAILDLDHFKMVNDKYGHAVGDEVLKDLVAITTAKIRKYDRFYRFGGEEFVLMLPDIPNQQAFIHNLSTAIKKELKTPDGKEVTVSFGVASWVPGTTADSWLKNADDALYRAKANGRDCAIFSDD